MYSRDFRPAERLSAALLSLALLCAGCTDSTPAGKYSVVDIDKTLAGINEAPRRATEQMTLEQYRDHI
jgi:hypothetical protein